MKLKGLNVYLILVLLILVQFMVLFKTSYTVWPEMVLYPWLLSHNYVFYKDIVAPYFPLMPYILGGLARIFGESILLLKVTTYFLIFMIDLSIFYAVLRLSENSLKAVLAVSIYAILQISYGGNALWFELFLAPLVVLALTLVYLDFGSKNRIILAGLLLGIAVLVKQNAILFFIPAGYFLIKKGSKNTMVWFVFPVLVLFSLLLTFLNLNHMTADFYTWAVKLPLTFSKQPGFVSMPAIRQYPFVLFPAAVVLAIYFWEKKENWFWVLNILIALSFSFPRYEDFHSQVLVALSALLVVFLPKKFLAGFLVVVLIIFGRNESLHFGKQDRFLDQPTYDLAQKISNYNSVYLVNSPELAYFLANKLPPKPWATNFPWYFEQSGFQNSFISRLEDQNIETVVIGPRIGGGKYALGNYIPDEVLAYVYLHYQVREGWNGYSFWSLVPF